jgi:DNA invertase Pin-like site-specific DNA recombinase
VFIVDWTMSKKVIQLLRVSTEGQAADDKAGLAAQRTVTQRVAIAHGLEIVKTIEMSDVSGTAVLRAPEMRELLRLIESPDIHGVVAKEFSRLMRPENFKDYELLQAFVDTRTVLYLPDGPIDFSSSMGGFIGLIRAGMARIERREILARMNDAKEAMRLAGRNTGGRTTLPFGVDYSDARGWSYTADAEKVRAAFDLVRRTSLPYAEIARRLNIPRTNLRFILKNPIYIGIRQYDQRRDPSPAGYKPRIDGRQGHRRKIARAPQEVIRRKVMDGLISQEMFQAVQQILNSRAARERAARTKNAPKYLFNGFLYCGVCDSPMYSHTNQKDTHYYCKLNSTRAKKLNPKRVCPSRYIRAAVIEPKIEELLSVRLQDNSFLEIVANSYLKQQSPEMPNGRPDAGGIQRQIDNFTAKRGRILEAFFDGTIDRMHRDEQLNTVDKELGVYQGILATSPATGPCVSAADLADLLSVFAEMPFLQRGDKRTLLRGLGVRIFAVGYEIRALAMQNPSGLDCDTDNRSKTALSVSRAPRCR